MTLRKLSEYKRILILPIFILCLGSTPIFAQSSLSIGVAPTSKVLRMEPGETYSDEIVFWNQSKQGDTYRIFVSAFQQIENQPGTAIILTEEEDEQFLFSASKWITVSESSIFLEPSKNTKLQYTIKVPSDTTKGEFYAEIFLISENDYLEQGTATFANLAAGIPILIQIGDEFVENAELLRFTTNKKTYEKIFVYFNTTIKNLGDTHINPTGEIRIENIFKQEIARIQFNRNRQSLLRDNTGNYEDEWIQHSYLSPNNALAIGPMKATLIVTYRSIYPGFAVLNSETSFWIIPWKIIIAIITVLLLAIIIRISKKKREKRK